MCITQLLLKKILGQLSTNAESKRKENKIFFLPCKVELRPMCSIDGNEQHTLSHTLLTNYWSSWKYRQKILVKIQITFLIVTLEW